MKINRHCVICSVKREINVDIEGFANWQNGARIQDALPDLSADDREMLISSICPTCWETEL